MHLLHPKIKDKFFYKHLFHRAFLSFILLSLILVNSAQAEVPKLLDIKITPKISSKTLDNQMKVVVISDHRAPTATQMVWYGVGSADEPSGKSGIAHFLEHLMFKGTERVPSGAFSKIVGTWGGVDNAFTSYDYTAYYQSVHRERLADVMRLESDRMINLRLARSDVLTERKVILEERSQRTDNNPEAILHEQMFASLFLSHPYGHPVIGWKHEIEELDRKDALEFYRNWYSPSNATLVLAGDIMPEEGFKLAEEIYGNLKPPRPRRGKSITRVKEPPHFAARHLQFKDERVGQEYLLRYYLIESEVTDLDEAAKLQIFAKSLGSGTTSWLYKDMVKDKQVALAAGAGVWDSGKDYSILTIYAVPTPEMSLEKLESKLDDSLKAFIEHGLNEEKVRLEQNVMLANYVFSLDSQFQVANAVGNSVTNGLDPDSILRWPDIVKNIEFSSLPALSEKWLNLDWSVTGYLLKSDGEGDSSGNSDASGQ